MPNVKGALTACLSMSSALSPHTRTGKSVVETGGVGHGEMQRAKLTGENGVLEIGRLSERIQ